MFFLPFIAAVACSNSSDLVIKTNVGTFRGRQDDASVRTWLGIPFGASTNGSLRFRPPQRAAVIPDGTVFNATQLGLGCPQNKGAGYQGIKAFTGGRGTGNFSEGDDCLNLNIWSPSTARTNGTNAAVMIWVYGGSGQFGGSGVPIYNGSDMVRDQDDIVVVSINYRTNIFGSPFGAGSAIPIQQANPALLDLRLAVEWVYANIRNFGGDPDRIVLFGESAGAGAIGTWPYAYEFDPIVKGLIMESGTEDVFFSQGGPASEVAATNAWNTVANATGCNSTRMTVFECMQNLPYQTIQQAVSNYSGSGIFGAQVDNITLYSKAEYPRRRIEGRFAKLPILVGTNRDEGTLFAAGLGINPDIITQVGFLCPAIAVAGSRANHSVPAYQYEYIGNFSNINTVPSLGVFHGSEMPMVFGTYNLSSIPATSLQVAQSRYIQSAWAAFARDPSRGLAKLGWSPFAYNGSVLNVIGGDTPLNRTANVALSSCSPFFPELNSA